MPNIGATFNLDELLGIECKTNDDEENKRIIRDKKGKSLLNLPNNYTIIDIETTGLDPKYDNILEIAAIKVKNNKVINTFQTLIYNTEQIDGFITELTGITTEMVKNAPKINKAIELFIKFIENDILIGHNVNFDINFLYDNCLKYNNYYLDNNFVDTMRLSRKINKNLQHHRLIDLIELYSIDVDNQHRALDDCYITFEVYNKLKNSILELYIDEDDFITQNKKYKKLNRAKYIVAKNEEIDEDNPLFGKEVVFTGILEKMIRKEAMQIVANLGGKNRDTVTKNTNYLILGNNDYCTTIKDGKSSKQKKAEKYKLKGCDIEIISENVFYDMIDDYINN